MSGAVALSLLLQTSPLLDGPGLKEAMIEAARAQDAASLTGRRFRLELPFVEQKVKKYNAYKQSARWSYDHRQRLLTATIGMGEITAKNFERFRQSGLDDLPPLQTIVFDVATRDVATSLNGSPKAFSRPSTRGQTMGRPADGPGGGYNAASSYLSAASPGGGATFDEAVASRATSFGIAVPYDPNGVSALPAGFSPLVASQLREEPRKAEALASSLTLVVEGQITARGQKPEVFCGGFVGAITAEERKDYRRIFINDHQCFVTARIERLTVRGPKGVLAAWPTAEAPAAGAPGASMR